MVEWWNAACGRIGDAIFGWILDLSPGAALLGVALATALAITGIRPLTTDQDLLRRAASDRKRLKDLLRDARRRKDRGAVRRHKATRTLVALRALRQELAPLLVSLPPVAVLATWCALRLGHHPPRENEPIEVLAYTPISAIGGIVHLVPAGGLSAADGWVRAIEEDRLGERVTNGVARWRLRGEASPEPYRLLFRCRERTIEHELLIGQRAYSTPVLSHDESGQWVTELRLAPVKLFGFLPGYDPREHPELRGVPLLGWLALPAWLAGYLLIAVPLAFVLKPMLRIY